MVKLVVRKPGPEGRFGKQWKWDPVKRRLDNSALGAAYQVYDAADEATGEIMYEGVALVSRRCELHVVVREDDMHLGFVYHRRLSVIPAEFSRAAFADDSMQVLSIFDSPAGIEEYECSHGLARNRLEEVLEEIGLAVNDSVLIGAVKDTPPIGGISHELFAVKVGRTPSGKGLERGEEIGHVKFFAPEEVRKIIAGTICGLTKAALWTFRSWGLDNAEPGSFWYEAARRL